MSTYFGIEIAPFVLNGVKRPLIVRWLQITERGDVGLGGVSLSIPVAVSAIIMDGFETIPCRLGTECQ
jgi:hypothetical protein